MKIKRLAKAIGKGTGLFILAIVFGFIMLNVMTLMIGHKSAFEVMEMQNSMVKSLSNSDDKIVSALIQPFYPTIIICLILGWLFVIYRYYENMGEIKDGN